jgi:hypothetical protein
LSFFLLSFLFWLLLRDSREETAQETREDDAATLSWTAKFLRAEAAE